MDKFEAVTEKKDPSFFQNVTEYVVAINRNFEPEREDDIARYLNIMASDKKST
ncbi:MAG: hypothetical protein J7M20_10300 [Deltaproteobacteria bacterium]|nr:hypothetical protein [Deltaproteobacteria bacterium]